MPVINPIPTSLIADVRVMQERARNLGPVFGVVERMIQRFKREDFRAGRGPDGPHRGLASSTRRGHRTGIPLFNTGDLMRSFTERGHRHYIFEPLEEAFVSGSSHPVLRHLKRRGYSVSGLSSRQWREIDAVILQYIETGSV